MFQLNIQTGSHLQIDIAYKKDDILHSGKTKCMYQDNQDNYIHA